MSAEIAEFLDDGPAEEPEIQLDDPMDMRVNLTELGIEEIERGVCEDNYDNRAIIRRAKLRYQALYDQFGRATGLINVITPESLIERRILALSEKKPLMVDPDNRNSEYLTGVDLLLDDRACAITPPWVIGATRAWVAQTENGGVPEKGRKKAQGLPGRCRAVKTDSIRCMLWHSGKPQDDGLCRTHLKVARKPSDDVRRAREKLFQAAPYAVDTLEELMDSAESEPVRLKASTEILDRAGIRGGQDFTVDVEVTDTRTASQVVIERLARLAAGAAMVQERQFALEEDGQVVDAEVVEDSDQGGPRTGDKPSQIGQEDTSPGTDMQTTSEDGGLGVQSWLNTDFDDDELNREARS